MTTKQSKTEPKTAKKITLFDAVQENPAKQFIKIGALANAGLLRQYEHEKKVRGVENLRPSITKAQFEKIVKNYIGD